MVVTTIGNINFYDGAGFSHVNSADEDRYTLKDYHGHYHLYFDNNHHLWLKNKQVASCVDMITEHYVNNVDSVFRLAGANGKVDDMFIDTNGDLWMCISGRIQCNKYQAKFPLEKGLNLQELAVFGKRQLLLFYENGLTVALDVNTGKRVYQNVAYDDEDAAIYNQSSVLKMHENGLYMIRNGEHGALLQHYDAEKREWKILMRADYHLNNMVIHDGKLYIASEWGYYTYHMTTGETVHYKSLVMQNGRKLETDVNALEFDLQGGMWIGTEQRGLLYAPPLNAPFQLMTWDNPLALKYGKMMDNMEGIYEYKGIRANVMLIDSRNWTWVGTRTGLYLYNNATPQAPPTIYSTKNGLMNNVVHSIVEDDMHNIWASTSYGICCIQIVDGTVKQVYSFAGSDNIPNETFINAKAMKLPDGTIVMQALDHVITFQPRDFVKMFNQQAYEMHPKLTKMLVNGIEVRAGDKIDGEVIMDRAVARTAEINLNYYQNSISLTFSALNYARPLQTYYRVRIREISKEWVDYSYFTGSGLVDKRGLLHLPMTGLKPGTYHIELIASVVPGQFVGEPYEWTVNVNQPWWRTTGLMLLVGLLVLAMAGLNFYVYNRNTNLKMRRSREEGDVIRRVKGFVERCEGHSNEKLSPSQEDLFGVNQSSNVELSKDFIRAMLKIIPYVNEHGSKTLTMHMLANATGLDVITLYELMSENIHKSPLVLERIKRVRKVKLLLKNTDKPIEEIAEECGFDSPNYMLAKFFQFYRITPQEYRLLKAKASKTSKLSKPSFAKA